MVKICAVLPVKSTSDRIVSKNFRLLAGKPLFVHALEKLIKVNGFDEVWIDTDEITTINIANHYGIYNFKYFIRDKKYATNATNGNMMMKYEIENIDSDIYVQVLCTSPFLKISTLEECADLLRNNKCASLTSIFADKIYVWDKNGPIYDKYNIPNSKDLDDTFIECMSIYGITKSEFESSGLRIGANPKKVLLSREESIDINFPSDFEFAEKIAISNKLNETKFFNSLKVKLNSCMLADILNEIGENKFLIRGLIPNVNSSKIFGRVRPIQIRELDKNEDLNGIYACLKSYKTICNDDIIFVNNKVDKCAYFGDLNATLSICSGAQATIINGYTRDIERTIELKYPVFYKDSTCNDVKGKGTLDYYDQPIVVDGIKIHVGDLIFGDRDGVVVINRDIEEYVLKECINIINKESNVSNSIVTGTEIDTILEKFGMF